jgi:hypothetical protein
MTACLLCAGLWLAAGCFALALACAVGAPGEPWTPPPPRRAGSLRGRED